MITIFRGARGRGKTLSMTKEAYRYYKAGYKILANYSLEFGEFINSAEVLGLNRESDLRNCVLVLDEVQLFFDSRNFMKSINKDFSNFVQQIRKRNIKVLCTTQYINTIDLRLRQHIDVVAYPFYNDVTKRCLVVYFDVSKTEDLNNQRIPAHAVSYDAKPVFTLFNTYEMLK